MSIETVLRNHFFRYPAMQIQDVYKLIHQAALGSEHAISNVEGVRKWLEQEIVEMGQGPADPLIDPISADGQIARVHLRPFVEQGGNTDMLLRAFAYTASAFHGDTQVLENYWQIALATEHFSYAEMNIFFQSMRTQNYPGVHHSAEYKQLYRPAYRVVVKELLGW